MEPHFAYIRVSSTDQNESRQLEGVEVQKTFIDRCSGKDTERPELQRALEHLREGDTLHVHSIDRLARNLQDLQSIVEGLNERGVTVKFHTENLTFTGDESPMQKLMFQMMGAFAQFERSLIKERQREGIEAAKKRGVYKGRKPALTPEQVEEVKNRVVQGANKASLARELGVSRQTIYAALRAN
ncbi:recombinase family protein [Pseudodesulfovibrio sediminis]|uniref:Resolvase n=1 Tax=Pseudodesulfovibrio sediminis TaxID=2810563 RepID=A0ABM7P2Y0_9BACT|nr:recombinase family protein [Pseudodesulfovibrio sediminis]BCS87132.1 resolvase [Pseudodesulfovibrio sediminis]